VIATRTANYEHVAKLIHCRVLMRDDPDYEDHHGKSVHSIVLCDDSPLAVRDFACQHRVRIVTPVANSESEG